MISYLFLKFVIWANGLWIKEDRVMSLKPIISSCIKESLSVTEKRNINSGHTNFFISWQYFQLLCINSKRHKLLKKVNFWYYTEKVFNRNFKFSLDSDWNLLRFFNYFVKHSNSFLFFIEYISSLIEELVIMLHSIVFFMNFLNEFIFRLT
jgi:hypothetical protein